MTSGYRKVHGMRLKICISWDLGWVHTKNGAKFRGSRLNYETASEANGAHGANVIKQNNFRN